MDPPERGGAPPVERSGEAHEGGDEHAPHEGGVDEDGEGSADPEQLRNDRWEVAKAKKVMHSKPAAVEMMRLERATPWLRASVSS